MGSALYLTQCTHYHLCYAVNELTRAGNKTARVQITAASHALKSLKGHPGLPILYKKGQSRLVGYTDASFAANHGKRQSTTVSIFFLVRGFINFGFKTQSLNPQFSV